MFVFFGSTHVVLLCRLEKFSLWKNEHEGLKGRTMSIPFLWRWGLVIVTYNLWNKTPESIFQLH